MHITKHAKHATPAITLDHGLPAGARPRPAGPAHPLAPARPAAVSAATGGARNLGGIGKGEPSHSGTGALNGTADHPQRPRPTHAPAPTGTADHPHIPHAPVITKELEPAPPP
ncbi:MAG: hypothetical protein JWM98_288 [Thermoleophilia bacterium]|nr:hypothetical protein [Thermoleophilia bacterium]